jgi:hypothetical protein
MNRMKSISNPIFGNQFKKNISKGNKRREYVHQECRRA